jgi:hypothetical protein
MIAEKSMDNSTKNGPMFPSKMPDIYTSESSSYQRVTGESIKFMTMNPHSKVV